MKASKKTRRRAPPRAPGSKARSKRAASSAPVRGARRAAKGSARPGAGAAASREVELEAAVLRRLLEHFDERKDVQNIELMILAGFCRNCLSKWLVEEGRERGLDVDIDSAREKVYGMPYGEWKEQHQQQATPEQLARFEAAEKATTKQ